MINEPDAGSEAKEMGNKVAGFLKSRQPEVCRLCKSPATRVFDLPLYSIEGDWITPVYRCRGCKTYMRDFDYSSPQMIKHFTLSTYTNLSNEKRLRHEKLDYFHFIANKAQTAGNKENDKNALDVGSCFGHLLDIFKSRNFQTFGVEPFEPLYREAIRRKNHSMFRDICGLPDSLKFDVITMLDTLYLIEDPLSLLVNLRKRIKPNGVLIIRIVNRVWILDTLRYLRFPVSSNVFGDHKYSFSLNGMRLLLKAAGFKTVSITGKEPGKLISDPKRRLLAQIFSLFSNLPGVNLAPGLILFCAPNPDNRI